MTGRLICSAIVLLLIVAACAQGVYFELLPTYDTYVSNDPTEGPGTSHGTGSGMHVRDVADRRRVGYLTYDLTEARTQGAFFSNVSFSNYGHDTGTIHVYGILESQEALVVEGLTWNNAPGVMNDPTPAANSPVALDLADLTDVLLTFAAPARGTRAATETSEALADFLNSDTNGFVAFLFAPAEGGNAILRTVELGAEGGTLLVFEIGGRATAARDPEPEDGATDVYRDVELNWTPGGYAGAHDVYLGTDFDDVNDADRANPRGVLVGQGQEAATYDPGRLELGTTYYWRIDEVNATPDATIFKGLVWSFTTEPPAYAIENITVTSNGVSDEGLGPENTIDGSGLNDDDQHSVDPMAMWLATPDGEDPIWIQYEFDRVYQLHELWVWNYNVLFETVLGYGLKDVTIEVSTDGTDWTVFGDVEFAKATAKVNYGHNTTVDLGGIAARFVRLTVNSGWGSLGHYGLSEVRFLHIPAFARAPQPADGQTDVSPDAALRWRAGRDADLHQVYLGADPEALALIDTTAQDRIAPAGLEFGTTYYWRIDEVNEAEAVAVWQSDLWRFATQEYQPIDGFESYTDDIDAGEAIFDTWLDGWVNDTGSTVGYLEAPFAERTIVRSGAQSMPLAYDNSDSPWYSEAKRIFDTPQNWAVFSAETLVVYFQGRPGPFVELASGRIVMGAAGADIWDVADEFRFGYKSLVGDGSIVARVENLTNTHEWAKAGVMIRQTLEPGSAFAAVYLTPGSGCRYQGRLTTGAAAVSDTDVATAEQIAMTAPYWIKLERSGSVFNGYYSADGQNWTAMSWNPQTIAMNGTVYIGLAVTSHNTAALASAEFSGVATTGNVTGPWAVQTIGPEQPAGNSPDTLYVAVEDTAGKTAVVTHPAGEAATLLAGWNQWHISFGDLAGVSLDRVKSMAIGIGDRSNPKAAGTGLIYIDDLSFGKPAVSE